MTTTDDARPRRVVTVGNMWAVAYARAKRGEEDLCQGSILAEGWEAVAAQIVAVPFMLEVLRAVAEESPDLRLKRLAERALKKAGTH
jgi:hypothetical protein